jgi:group I intron endonuclease
MTGIYKITSPTGRIYIGQSVHIKNRFLRYKSLDCKCQTKLYKSFLKHGYANHLFEILEECEINDLNNKERYWQDYFKSADRGHLNCRYTSSKDKTGFMSDESKSKMSKTRTGMKRPVELIERLRIINTGSKRSLESRKKMSIAQTGKKHSSETKEKMSIAHKGRVVSDETKAKMRLVKGKKIICLETGEIYVSLVDYCEKNKLNYKTTWNKFSKNKLKIKQYEQ